MDLQISTEDDDIRPNRNAKLETPEILQRKYRFVRLLGEGASGRTYLATERISGNRVAIKQFKSFTDFKSFELFKREVETMRSVDIVGVPRYIDYVEKKGSADGYYLVQEYFDGESLLTLIDRLNAAGRLFAESHVWNFARQIAGILDKLETQYQPPIIHRDIKPSNIMVTPDMRFYLIDFGSVANPERKSLNSTIAGTQGYMAPEQCMGDCTIQSDYYALGATMLHMLTGVAPFNIDVQNSKLCFEDVIANKAPKTGKKMTETLAQLLAFKPEDRPKNSEQLQILLSSSEREPVKFAKSRLNFDFSDWRIFQACGLILAKLRVIRGILRIAFIIPIAWQWALCNASSRDENAPRIAVFYFPLLAIAAVAFLTFLFFDNPHPSLAAKIHYILISLCLCIPALVYAYFVPEMHSSSRCLFQTIWKYEDHYAITSLSHLFGWNAHGKGDLFENNTYAVVAKIQKVDGDRRKRAYYTAIINDDVYVGSFTYDPSKYDKDEYDRLCRMEPEMMADFDKKIQNNEFLKGAKVNIATSMLSLEMGFVPADSQSDIRMRCMEPWLCASV